MLPSVLLLALAAPALAAQEGPRPMPGPPMIEVAGTGEATATPDRAHVVVAVQTKARTAAAAGQENATRSQRVLQALRALGIPAAQLATLDYTVQPSYTYPGDGKPPVLAGYEARSTVRVEVRSLPQVGPVLDAALGAGANSIGGVTFFVANPEAVRRDALAAATTDARLSAETIAKAAGGTLGGLLLITTQDDDRPRPVPMLMAARAEMAKADTPITPPSEQTVTARVVARWAFVPAAR
jgi:hypothetical protein